MSDADAEFLGNFLGEFVQSLPPEEREEMMLELMNPLISDMPLDALRNLKTEIQCEIRTHRLRDAAVELIEGRIALLEINLNQ